MGAFKEALKVEARSFQILKHYIGKHSLDGRYVTTAKGRLSRELQKTVGDVLLNNEQGEVIGLELKAEESNKYGNFFIETWSNKHLGTLGWFFTLNTDVLLYHFLEQDELYIIHFGNLKTWLTPVIERYPERVQGKREQLNDTWGRCVPIHEVEKHIGFRKHSPLKEWRKINERPDTRYDTGTGSLPTP